MAKPKSRIVPEFQVRTKRARTGFVASWEEGIEVWQVWCRRSDDSDESRRATVSDLNRAGFVKRKR
jgi:hypothetical protein